MYSKGPFFSVFIKNIPCLGYEGESAIVTEWVSEDAFSWQTWRNTSRFFSDIPFINGIEL